MKKLAIFDIDGTIFRSSLLIEVVRELIAEEIFPKSAERVYAESHENWLNRTGGYEEYIMDVVRVFEKHIKGVSYEDFLRISRKVALVHKRRVYTYTRDLVKKLKKKGYFLLAISQSPKSMLDDFCRAWGFDKVYGRMYEINNKSLFTGKTLFMEHIANKENILRRFVEKETLSLEGSVGVGDTEGDITFLTFVENPICFNPNKKLYEHAKKHRWKIIVERKDVIYTIQ